MNKVILTGRLTRDIELRYTNGQMAVAKFTLAVDRIKKGEGKDADFLRVVAFGKTAENCDKFIKKGSLVGVEGSITTGSYQDKNGATVYTTDILADRVEFLEPRKAAADYEPQPPAEEEFTF